MEERKGKKSARVEFFCSRIERVLSFFLTVECCGSAQSLRCWRGHSVQRADFATFTFRPWQAPNCRRHKTGISFFAKISHCSKAGLTSSLFSKPSPVVAYCHFEVERSPSLWSPRSRTRCHVVRVLAVTYVKLRAREVPIDLVSIGGKRSSHIKHTLSQPIVLRMPAANLQRSHASMIKDLCKDAMRYDDTDNEKNKISGLATEPTASQNERPANERN